MAEMPSLTYKFDNKSSKIMELIDKAPSIFKHDALSTLVIKLVC